MAVAFSRETTSAGRPGGQSTGGVGGRGMRGGGNHVIEKIVFNKNIDDSMFQKPGNN